MSLLDRGRTGLPIIDCPIIDMHGHLGRYSHAIPDLSPGGLVKGMDRIGIQSTLCSHMACMSHEARAGNREVLVAIRAFPGRIEGYLSLWPWGPDAVRDELAWGLDAGFIGIKLHNANGFPYTDSTLIPAYELAEEREMPILFHTWGSDTEFHELHWISEHFPHIPLLIAHAGCINVAGYINLGRKCSNIYLELAFSAAPRGMVAHLVDVLGAERIIWGSDVYFYSQSQQIGRVLGARISEEEKRLILSGNAARILSRFRGE